MDTLNIYLFGRFRIKCGGSMLSGLEARKSQELFSYLLLNANRSHPREALADLLWEDGADGRSKKYLRQALWHLRSALDSVGAGGKPDPLLIDSDYIGINPEAELWVDCLMLEKAYAQCRDVSGYALDQERATLAKEAVNLYQGELLSGWYYDWCLYERERYLNLFLNISGKLINYYELQQIYDSAIELSSRILSIEPAHERTHRCLMRLYYLAGDRTAALRQYQQCLAILQSEFDVSPTANTIKLYQLIQADHGDGLAALLGHPQNDSPNSQPRLNALAGSAT